MLTILAFSLERYLVICRPLYVFPVSDLKRAVVVSTICWAVAMMASIPYLLFTRYCIRSGTFAGIQVDFCVVSILVYPYELANSYKL